MVIVDSHLHLWGADSAERPWPPGRAAQAHRPEPVSAAELIDEMDRAGVHAAVLIPPSWEGDKNDLALEAAQRHPDRFAVMGRLPLEGPDNRGRVATWLRAPGMLGLRLTFHLDPWRRSLADGTTDWLWEEAEREAVPVMVAMPGALATLDHIATRHPGLRIVIDHAGTGVTERGAAAFAELPAVCRMARHENVAVKLSGLPALSLEPFPFRDLHEPIRRLLDAFGPRRAFWGSDLTRLPCRYRQCVELFTDALPGLTEEDRRWIMGQGLCTWLRWHIEAKETPV